MVVAETNGSIRQEARLRQLERVVESTGSAISQNQLMAAYKRANERLDHLWQTEHLTPTVDRTLHLLWDDLELVVSEELHAETVRVFEEGLLVGPPDLAEGLPEAVETLAQHTQLGIISDTRFSPGRVIRLFLEERGLKRFFSGFVFSDETGIAKPEEAAFERAADQLSSTPGALTHIGDIRRTDIAGARRVGATGVLYTGIRTDTDTTPQPHHELSHWNALPELLKRL